MKAVRNSQTWNRSGRALTSAEYSICETELGSDDDEEDMYYSDPEGPYIDEPIADEEWLTEYNREVEEIERRHQELQNRFDRIVEPETW